MISDQCNVVDTTTADAKCPGGCVSVQLVGDTGVILMYSLLLDKKCGAEGAAVRITDVLTDSISRDVHSGCCVDENMQDQLIIYMALAAGESRIRTGRLTLHTTTAIHFCSVMCDAKFNVLELVKDELYEIVCDGIGWMPR